MCFSAQTSFIAAGALSTISLLSIKKAGPTPLALLAISPLFFAIQQASEGFVWITLNANDTTSLLHVAGTQSFLFFASTFWPIWMPSIFYVLEKNRHRKKMLLVITCIGVITGILFFINWPLQTTGAHAINHHIDYPVAHYPFGIKNATYARCIAWILSLMYCIATCLPFFISSMTYVWIVGIAVVASFCAASLFYLLAFSSVWCFFAALSSVLLFFVIQKNKKNYLY